MKLTIIKLTIMEAKPELDDDRVDRKSDPEGDAEELAGCEVSEAAGGEENSHHRTRSGDAEQDDDGSQQPASFQQRFAALPVQIAAAQRVEEKTIEEQDG